MKKILKFMSLLVGVFVCVTIFSACRTKKCAHEFDAEWCVTADNHYHICVNCGKVEDYGNHVATENGWIYSATHHYQKCKDCATTLDYGVHQIEEDGKCSICGCIDGIEIEFDSYGIYSSQGGYVIKTSYGKKPIVKNITLPSVYDDGVHGIYPVVAIADSAFANIGELESITLPNQLKVIGNMAFKDCTNLSIINLSDTIVEIREEAFFGCKSLTEIVLPANINKIPKYAFYDCSNLKKVTLKNGVLAIDSSSFYGCESLEYVNFVGSANDWAQIDFKNKSSNPAIFASCLYLNGQKLVSANLTSTKISAYAFYGNTELANVTLAEETSEIGKESFYGCDKLTKIIIPKGVTKIGEDAFTNCSSLTDITLPFIGETAESSSASFSFVFGGTTSPENITLTAVKVIGDNAFLMHKKLKNLTIKEGLKTIGQSAFKGCEQLETVSLPKGVQTIGNYAFSGCTKLSEVTVLSGEICKGVFSYCDKLSNLVLGDEVSKIGEKAFASCVALESVIIPDSVTEIGKQCFFCCYNLKKIIVGSGVKKIIYDAVASCFALNDLFYKGTQEKWDLITPGLNSSSEITYYFYSEQEPVETGNYWHYDDYGNLVVWE